MKFIASIVLIGLIFPLFCQEKIEELVEVEWWVFPLLCVDKHGESVLDLKKDDVEVFMNGKRVEWFDFQNLSFKMGIEEDRAPRESEKKQKLVQKSTVFLLFDLSLSSRNTIVRSKATAKQIVLRAAPTQHFIIMSITPTQGMCFNGGPLNDKSRVLEILERVVKPHGRSGNFSIPDEMTKIINETDVGKYSTFELTKFLLPQRASLYWSRARMFFDSFEMLYYAIYSIKTHKFVYFFSEGVSRDAQSANRRDARAEYRIYFDKMADYLSRSGVILFIVDMNDSTNSNFSVGSGTDSLQTMARKSGGKHFKGTRKNMIDRIQNTRSAYYEIAFPDDPNVQGLVRDITVKSKRKGIDLITPRLLEKKKTYAEMNSTERAILALNLVYGNALFNARIPYEIAETEEILNQDHTLVYRTPLPDYLRGKKIDLFKVRFDGKEGEPAVRKIRMLVESNTMDIAFQTISERTRPSFVIFCLDRNLAFVKKSPPTPD